MHIILRNAQKYYVMYRILHISPHTKNTPVYQVTSNAYRTTCISDNCHPPNHDEEKYRDEKAEDEVLRWHEEVGYQGRPEWPEEKSEQNNDFSEEGTRFLREVTSYFYVWLLVSVKLPSNHVISPVGGSCKQSTWWKTCGWKTQKPAPFLTSYTNATWPGPRNSWRRRGRQWRMSRTGHRAAAKWGSLGGGGWKWSTKMGKTHPSPR